MSPPSTLTARRRLAVIALCFMMVLIDGYDGVTLALSIPAVAPAWGVEPAAFTVPLVISNVGVVLGYLLAGPLANRVARRALLVIALALLGLGTLGTGMALTVENLAFLTGIRLLAGFGIGLVLPLAVASTAETASDRARSSLSVVVSLGLSCGVLIAGLTSGTLIASFGVAPLFEIGGILALALAALVYPTLPRPVVTYVKSNRKEGDIRALVAGGRKKITVALWTFTFFIFLGQYTLTSWGPTLLLEYGFAATEAPLAAAALGLGGIISGVILIVLSVRFRITRVLLVITLVATAAIIGFAVIVVTPTLTLVLLLLGGGGLVAGMVGQVALGVVLYPVQLRATAIGLSSAWGRAASMVGPAVGGALLALAIPAREIVLLTVIPAVIGCIVLFVLNSQLGKAPAAAEYSPELKVQAS